MINARFIKTILGLSPCSRSFYNHHIDNDMLTHKVGTGLLSEFLRLEHLHVGSLYIWHNHKFIIISPFSEGQVSSLVSGVALICILSVDKYRYDQMIFGNGSLGICPFLYFRWNMVAVVAFLSVFISLHTVHQ